MNGNTQQCRLVVRFLQYPVLKRENNTSCMSVLNNIKHFRPHIYCSPYISEGVDKENLLKKSIAFLVSDHFLHSCYVNVSFRGDTVRRNYILIT